MYVVALQDYDCPTHKMKKGVRYEVSDSIGNRGIADGALKEAGGILETATKEAPETMEARKPTSRKKP